MTAEPVAPPARCSSLCYMSLHRWYCPFCGTNVFTFDDQAEVHYVPGERPHTVPPNQPNRQWMSEQIDAHLAEHAEQIVSEVTA